MISVFKPRLSAATLFASAAIMAGLAATPAKANVIYDLTFGGGGTGELVLNLDSLSAVQNISYTNIAPYLVELTANNVNGQSFLITTSNLQSGYVQTGAAGQIYTLTVQQSHPTGVPSGTNYLDVYTNVWQIHTTPWDSTVASNSLTISAPRLANASVPEPSSLIAMLTGLGVLGCLGYAMRRGSARLAAI